MPPPITSSRFGSDSSSSAPVESMIRGSSGTNGSFTLSEPAATMHCSKPIFCVPPPSAVTSTTFGATNRPLPCTTSTLRCLASIRRPLVSLRTTPPFQPRSFARSICGAPKLMPCAAIDSASSITLAACSSAFEGMQPTFRQTPPRLDQRSTSTTDRPRSAARNAAV